MVTLKDDKLTNQPTPSPLCEKEYAKNFEKYEERIVCDDEPKVEAFEKLETGLAKLEDEDPKEVNMIETPMEKHLDEAVHGALMSHFDTIHKDDAPYIKESIAHTTAWSEKVLPLVTNDDPPLEKPSDPPKPILKPFPCGLKCVFIISIHAQL